MSEGCEREQNCYVGVHIWPERISWMGVVVVLHLCLCFKGSVYLLKRRRCRRAGNVFYPFSSHATCVIIPNASLSRLEFGYFEPLLPMLYALIAARHAVVTSSRFRLVPIP
jgi:hypothetical protein